LKGTELKRCGFTRGKEVHELVDDNTALEKTKQALRQKEKSKPIWMTKYPKLKDIYEKSVEYFPRFDLGIF